MVKDISADVVYITGVWTEGVLYGIQTSSIEPSTETDNYPFHVASIIVYLTLCYIFTLHAYTHGREASSRILLTLSTIMFALSTAHIGLAVRELLDRFVFQSQSTRGGLLVFFRENVFPKWKAIYIFNTLLGDVLLVWRVYVIYRQNWLITTPSAIILIGTTITGMKTVAADVQSEHTSVFNPSILHWVTATFALTISTQIISTALIAGRIYVMSRPYSFNAQPHAFPVPANTNAKQPGSPLSSSEKTAVMGARQAILAGGHTELKEDTQRAKYLVLVLVVAKSGAVYTSAVLVQLITYLLNMNAGVILKLMLAQLSAVVPIVIVLQVGLGLTYKGPNPRRVRKGAKDWPADKENVHRLSTFHAAGGATMETHNEPEEDVGRGVLVEHSVGSKTQVATVGHGAA